ncbi:Protein N-terminal amidase [Ceratocystis fimbriata CBS 114723]|uniref:Protein N-terminal amidase n=1 Tax=Ceratocystis fimbriata CBS 114723 TaxID=1035309 RepID=A0A2C5X2T6_9PEZI|nr:Protein N-terminal amidase [Ceratocystis fimbriata CBS 114723]
MRIACLQFSPVRGDVNNNLSRADSVLLKAADNDKLDLIVLPEMAFTGCKFQSRQAIQPLIEPSLSGISSLWARTTALRHDCYVAVGYPEKTDANDVLEGGPRFYNSLMMVSHDGESVVNYRKPHLYTADEAWAMEGNGFYGGWIAGMGRVAMGISMDLNPYRFEASWESFEFAHHVLTTDADLVIISMAWITGEDVHSWSQTPREPDMDCLSYWIARLEPLIRAETAHEILVVIANRTGIEDDVVYAGTSAVLGFQGGEVKLYGLLGRGEKGLLVVDTDEPPMGKLVYRPDETTKEHQPGESDLPGLVPNPDAIHTMSPVGSPDGSLSISPLCAASNSVTTPDSVDGKQATHVAERDTLKLGVVPEQDEPAGGRDFGVAKEWAAFTDSRIGSGAASEGSPKTRARVRVGSDSKSVQAGSASDVSLSSKIARTKSPALHRRTDSLNDCTGGPPSIASLLQTPNKLSFSGTQNQHTRHQSLDAVIEQSLLAKPRVGSTLATRQKAPAPALAMHASERSPSTANPKAVQPKLKLQTNSAVLRQMEDNSTSDLAHATLSAKSYKPPVTLDAGSRNYPATAVEENHVFDWQPLEPKSAGASLSQENQGVESSASSPPNSLYKKQRANRPKLSITTTSPSALPWKKTDTRGIVSAVDPPRSLWPVAGTGKNQTDRLFVPASAIATVSKDQFWATASVPQTGNTEAFNLASISYTLGEVAMAGMTPEAEKALAGEDADEAWYRSPIDTTTQANPFAADVPRGREGTSAHFSSVGDAISRQYKAPNSHARDAGTLYPPVPNPSQSSFGQSSAQKYPTTPEEPFRQRSRNEKPRDATSVTHSGQTTTGSLRRAMTGVDVAYPPIPSPSIYSSQNQKPHKQQQKWPVGNPSRPYEALRSAEAFAEPVSWVDRWMPPPAGMYQQGEQEDPNSQQLHHTGQGQQQQQQQQHYHQDPHEYQHQNQPIVKPGLNLLVPAFSSSTETLATPSMLNPKTPKTPAGHLVSRINAQRHPASVTAKEMGNAYVSRPEASQNLHIPRPHREVFAEAKSSNGNANDSDESESTDEDLGNDVSCDRKQAGAEDDGPCTPKAMSLMMDIERERPHESSTAAPIILGGSHTILA